MASCCGCRFFFRCCCWCSAKTMSAVSFAREREEDATTSRGIPARTTAAFCAWSLPLAFRGTSYPPPWMRPSAFQSVSPWRTRYTRTITTPLFFVVAVAVAVPLLFSSSSTNKGDIAVAVAAAAAAAGSVFWSVSIALFCVPYKRIYRYFKRSGENESMYRSIQGWKGRKKRTNERTNERIFFSRRFFVTRIAGNEEESHHVVTII
mmetsp:Transcript_6366/g.15064  ORF Transcript_6366/g.15064 Transcript_6366/m.15064 type:complete len:206 (-) Transcript_6366:99-716(-)